MKSWFILHWENKMISRNMDMKELTFDDIDRIKHHLMLNTYFTHDIGFFHGQMGVAIVMSEYSRYMSNELYSDVASYLLDNIMENVHENLTYSFDSGLSGIGWGIEYLIQHGFVEGESIDVCEEIDRKIMETDPKRIADFLLDKGFEGLLHYVIYHLQGAIRQKSRLPFDERYLSDLYDACTQLRVQEESEALHLLLDVYKQFYRSGIIENYNVTLVDFVSVESGDFPEKIISYPLGLKEGLAGKLLKTIFVK